MKLTYNVLQIPVSLMRWIISENNKCKCGRNGTLRHILSVCTLGLKERYTWRRKEMMQVFKMYLGEKIVETNKGKLPTKGVRKNIDFHKEGKKGDVTASNTSKVEDKRWGGM